MSRTQPELLYRLRQEFMSAVEHSENGWPSLKAFQVFARSGACGRKGSFERDYPLLRRGCSVPKSVVEAMLDYAHKRLGMAGLTLDAIAIHDPYAERERGDDADRWNFEAMLSSVRARFRDRSEMYFDDPERDALAAARACMRTVGYMHAGAGEDIREEACVSRAATIMARSPEAYAQWLLEMHDYDYHTTTRFVARLGRGKDAVVHYLGHCSMLPVSEEAFHRIASGDLAEMEIDPSHLSNPSPFLFIHGMAEPDATCVLPADAVSGYQARCMAYQAAYFTRGVRPLRPRIVTLAGTQKYAARLERQGFVRSGHVLKGTHKDHPKDLMVLGARPGGFGFRTTWHTVVLRTILRLFRYANHKTWATDVRE